MIKNVIFGTTRTLCNPLPFILKARNKVFERHNVKLTNDESNALVGKALTEQLEEIHKLSGIKFDWDKFSKETKENSNELMKGNLKAFEGMESLFEELKEKRIEIAISSQNLKENVLFYLKEINLDKYFKKMITIEDLEKFRPHPQILELMLKKLEQEGKDCIYVDVKKENLVPAKKLGMKTILFENPEQLKKELKELL
ncbi:HAD-IA family hydrolase [archaeon]|jgi:HAD superfamily hydrolase (TIGR01509 family)|nr:HAD-IA family hydrolase [archaeon]